MDEGLASRIKKILLFPSYSREELTEIFYRMVKERGWKLEKGWEPILDQYIVRKKQMERKNFGNAREMRKLMETAVECSCYRMYQKKGPAVCPECRITLGDLRHAVKELLPEKQEKRQIGFVAGSKTCFAE